MKKLIIKLLCKYKHKPINEVLVYESNNTELKTFNATCDRCKCNLFGMQNRGEFSGEIVRTFISIS